MPLPFRSFGSGLYAAGQPTPAELAAAAAAGVATVINLRAPDEPLGFDEAAAVVRLGMRYIAIPVAGAHDVTPEAAARLSNAIDAARADGGMLVHCASANRVGALVALDAGRHRGVAPADALALGRAAGLASLEPLVERLLSGPARE